MNSARSTSFVLFPNVPRVFDRWCANVVSILLIAFMACLLLGASAPPVAQGAAQYTVISSMSDFTCGTTTTGNAKCWGNYSFGSFGSILDPGVIVSSSTVGSAVPVEAEAFDNASVSEIIAGDWHSCAVIAGAAKCSGQNYFGELGDGTTTASETPVQVTGLTSGVSKVAAGGESDMHSGGCAIVGGALYCWGNTAGVSSNTPVAIAGLSDGVTDVSFGGRHVCAVQYGAAKCFGNDSFGQVGDGLGFGGEVAPSQVVGLTSGVTAIATGVMHSCAVVSGAVKCWGFNGSGQLGDDSTSNADSPVDVVGLGSGSTDVAVGDLGSLNGHSCAVVTGAVKCWGSNVSGQLGDGTNVDSLTPVQVSGITADATAVATGYAHSCAIVSGNVNCWGANSGGELGNGTLTSSNVPTALTDVLPPPPVDPPAPTPLPVSPIPPAPPSLTLPKSVRFAKRVALRVTCPLACTIRMELRIGRIKSKLPSIQLSPTTSPTTVKVSFGKKTSRKIRDALKRKKKVVLAATPTSGGSVGGTASTRLK